MKKIILFFCALMLCAPVYSSDSTPSAGAYVSSIRIMKKYKDISHNWRVLNEMRDQARGLSSEEKAVIQKYVVSGAVRGENTFLLINCDMRNNLEEFIPKNEVTKPLKYRLDYYAKQLSAPISKTRLPQNMILYRGVDDKGIRLIFANLKIDGYINKPVSEENLKVIKQKLVGAKFEEKGFMSTSYDINCAKQTKFIFEVNAPKNLQALLLEDIGKKSEKEVLINRNTKWEVADVKIDKSKKTKQDFYRVKLKFIKND